MIISASRRTDIPAFYAKWFMNRIRLGYCDVPNPFNPRHISRVSLKPEDVETIVFWTRNPRPLMESLTELDKRGYRYYFQYTLMDNPPPLEPAGIPLKASIETFRELADRVGPKRMIWRYDPIIFSNMTSAEFHEDKFGGISRMLRGCANRCVVSLVDVYEKVRKRLSGLAAQGAQLAGWDSETYGGTMRALAEMARGRGMEIVSCAEKTDLTSYGILPGKCIDDDLISNVFGIIAPRKKDPSQRKTCGCVVSKDIGMYDTCLSGCQYCYATTDFERAKSNYRRHNPEHEALIGQTHATRSS